MDDMKDRRRRDLKFDDPPEEDTRDDLELEELEEVDVSGQDEEADIMPQSEIERVRMKHETALLAIDGVVGIGIGSNEIGDDAIVVYLRDEQTQRSIPDELEGFPVQTQITGEFDAYQL
ncbi:MAG: hypothetical protein V3T84_15805 [Phycisphaerales bacterium]